jgi:hypothetical protein
MEETRKGTMPPVGGDSIFYILPLSICRDLVVVVVVV